jgi:hypothetical protein
MSSMGNFSGQSASLFDVLLFSRLDLATIAEFEWLHGCLDREIDVVVLRDGR